MPEGKKHFFKYVALALNYLGTNALAWFLVSNTSDPVSNAGE